MGPLGAGSVGIVMSNGLSLQWSTVEEVVAEKRVGGVFCGSPSPALDRQVVRAGCERRQERPACSKFVASKTEVNDALLAA